VRAAARGRSHHDLDFAEQENSSLVTSESWDAEYRRGRYLDEEPVAFVEEILTCSQRIGLPPGRGLYIGCGNGRNYLPLVRGGLDLIGLDISQVSLEQLAARAPERAGDLVHGDVESLPDDAAFSIVIGIQVFQHGREGEAHAHIAAALRRLAPGGLFCVRVNAVGTDFVHEHRIVERNADGGFTVEYLSGPKTGLAIHFFAESELARLVSPLESLVPLRVQATERKPPGEGRWLQWEGIWRR
jgi:SAM-dependent methyltransferase